MPIRSARGSSARSAYERPLVPASARSFGSSSSSSCIPFRASFVPSMSQA